MYNQEINKPTIKAESKNLKIVLSLGLFLLLFLFVYVLFFVDFSSDEGFFGLGKKEETKRDAGEIEGEIFLTLSPAGTDKPNIYRLDAESMDLEEYLPDEENHANFMGDFSSDLNKMVFVRLYREGFFQLLLFDPAESESKVLTEKSEFFPRNPRFSFDSTKVVYWAFEKGTNTSAEYPEDNNIYILDLNDGSKNFLAKGVFPLFSPDDSKILFLKNEGLYLLDLETSEETLALGLKMDVLEEFVSDAEKEDIGLETWMSLRFTYSPTSNVLALTDTLGSYVHLFEISDWNDFEYSHLVDQSVTGANWPMFSPSGLFLALQEADVEESRNFISIMEMGSSNFVQSLELDDFDSNYIWISDWIVR